MVPDRPLSRGSANWAFRFSSGTQAAGVEAQEDWNAWGGRNPAPEFYGPSVAKGLLEKTGGWLPGAQVRGTFDMEYDLGGP